jgi:hypothetical protein
MPEFEVVCVNVFESDLFLLLDIFLESADRLCTRNFDREYVPRMEIIPMDETVEFEDRN